MSDRQKAWLAGEWVPADPAMRSFNGHVQSRKQDGREYGVFHEWVGLTRWTVRTRPLGPSDVPADGWSLPIATANTKRDLIAELDARRQPGLFR